MQPTAVVHCLSGHGWPGRTGEKVAVGGTGVLFGSPNGGPDDRRRTADREREARPLPDRHDHRDAVHRAVRRRLAAVERGAPLERHRGVPHLLHADRLRRDRRLPSPPHASRVQGQALAARHAGDPRARRRSRARSSRGSPTTASTTPSPTSRATRTARTSTTATASRARCAGLFHAHVGWLFIHTQRGNKQRYAPDLMDDPLIRWVDRTFVLWVVVGSARAVPARLA